MARPPIARRGDGSACCWARAAGRRFIAYDCIGDAPLKTGSVPTPTYADSFPALDEQLYARMTDAGYGEEQTATVSDEDVAAAEAYVRWENEQLARVGELRADVRSLSGAFAGRTLVSFYLDNDALRAVDAERMQLHACAVEAITAALILYAAFTLLLAVWVFRDARRRDFLPAMWGLLTLIGNVVAWLVYMLVRSRGVGSRCPRCGTCCAWALPTAPPAARRCAVPAPPAAMPPRMAGRSAPTAAGNCPNGRRTAGAPRDRQAASRANFSKTFLSCKNPEKPRHFRGFLHLCGGEYPSPAKKFFKKGLTNGENGCIIASTVEGEKYPERRPSKRVAGGGIAARRRPANGLPRALLKPQ